MKTNPSAFAASAKFLCAALLALTAVSCATSKTASSVKPYPLKVCLVSGNDLDSMGDTITEEYHGKQVKFCCKPCVKKFHVNPEKYLSKIQ
jgi:YHS domain-containing protein